MRGEVWGDHRMERRSDFLDKDDCETGEGDQDEGGRTNETIEDEWCCD